MQWQPQTLTRVRQWSIAGVLLALVAGSVSQVMTIQAQQVEGQAQERQMVHNANLALELITRDVRMAGYSPTTAPVEGLAYTPTSVHLRADLNRNGVTAEPDEDVHYMYDPLQHQIRRLDPTGEMIIAEHIHTMTITGLDATGQPALVPAQARQLQITITAHAAPNARLSLPPYTMSTRVALRNVAVEADARRS